MSRKIETCFYCDCIFSISKTAIGDHFPVPDRYGGTDCVSCCVQCHSLKDRMNVGDWNSVMMGKVIADFPKLSRETRIFLAKALVAIQDVNEQQRKVQP